MVLLLAIGFLLGDQLGGAFVALAGLIMLLGRFWWPADVVRQLTWRVLEPRGILRRIDRHEDRATRRIARTIGGVVWLVSAVLMLTGFGTAGWVLTWLVGVMVVLDASVDFCALCFVFHLLERRHLLPRALLPEASQFPGEA